MIIVVMGVSGSGKSTIGAALAERLGGEFLEGDRYHPASNVAKMQSGIALTDDDRAAWLDNLADEIAARAGGAGITVISCSALRKRYRDRLREADPGLRLVFLAGSRDLLARRLAARRDHFMPPQLLASQLQTLEPPDEQERALTVDVSSSVADIVGALARRLEHNGPPAGHRRNARLR